MENGHDEIEPETEDKRDNESDVTEENGDKSCDIWMFFKREMKIILKEKKENKGKKKI